MNGLLTWTGNILFFLIFLAVLENLLPGKAYTRYIRLFAGMVVILIVIRPVTKGLNLEERIREYFEIFTFRQEASELNREILGIEQQRLARIMESYEAAAQADLDRLARDMGYVPARTRVVIEEDSRSERYGTVVYVEMEIEGRPGEEKEEHSAVQAINPVAPVTVSLEKVTAQGSGDEKKEDRFREGEEETGNDLESEGERGLDGLRRKVEAYYGLETENVEIKFQGK